MQAHELFPWVVIWDDHEFSDDHYGSVATYFDGRADEEDIARKRNAERAWMEYIPADIGLNEAGTGPALGDEHLYPYTRIYRSLNFGRNLYLILTDNRTHRPDHILEEDAFPGTIVIDEFFAKQLVDLAVGPRGFDQLRGLLDPYFDVAAERSYFGQPALGSQLPQPVFADTPFEELNFRQALTAIVSQQIAAELASLPEGQAPAVTPQAYANSAVQGNLSASWAGLIKSRWLNKEAGMGSYF